MTLYDILTRSNDFNYFPKSVYFRYHSKPKFTPYNPIPALYEKGCLTCGQKNVEVKYHGERHVCYKCKKYLQTPDGKPAILISTPDQKIMAFYKRLRVKYHESSKQGDGENTRRFSYVEVDPSNLRIFDRECFATYAGDCELIVLIKDDKKLGKQDT